MLKTAAHGLRERMKGAVVVVVDTFEFVFSAIVGAEKAGERTPGLHGAPTVSKALSSVSRALMFAFESCSHDCVRYGRANPGRRFVPLSRAVFKKQPTLAPIVLSDRQKGLFGRDSNG